MTNKNLSDFVPVTFIVEKCEDKSFHAFANYFNMI